MHTIITMLFLTCPFILIRENGFKNTHADIHTNRQTDAHIHTIQGYQKAQKDDHSSLFAGTHG